MKRHETIPMLLPWLAKQGGIDHDHAITLWRQAESKAAKQTGAKNTPEYWEAAMGQFRASLFEESLRLDIASCGVRPLVRGNVKRIKSAAAAFEYTSNLLHCWQRLSMRMLPMTSGRCGH